MSESLHPRRLGVRSRTSRTLRTDQPARGRRHTSAPCRSASIHSAVLAGYAQWGEGHRDARRAAGWGHTGAEYDAWLVHILQGDQFGSGFVEINPNSKIPALVDRSVDPPMRVFESGSIPLYLAERFGAFLPEGRARTGPELAVLAGGQHAVSGGWIWPLLQVCAGEAAVPPSTGTQPR